MSAILSIDRLKVRFRSARNEITAVRELSLEVMPGECVGVVGESGSGKTVVFMGAMGLLPKDALIDGTVRLAGVDMLRAAAHELNRVRGSRVAMIFQDPMTSLTPHLTIGAQLAEVLMTHARSSRHDAELASLRMLERVRVPDAGRRLRQYPHQLSGGLRQRVMIGMGLLCRPSLLIADEPTTALDVTVQAEIIDTLRSLRAETAMATVLISHDLGVIAGFADRIIVMYAGRIVESAAASLLLQRAMHPYTVELLKCVPNLHAPRLERMPTLPGTAPGASSEEAGCAFAPRCPQTQQRCRMERPLLREGSDTGRQVACHYPVPA